MGNPVVLGIDLVLGALIGPPGCAAENIIERAEGSREPNTPFDLPTPEEIEHWRDVVFDRQ